MDVIFSRRSFQNEILPQLGSNITLVMRNQDYADLAEKPKPSIPAFAGLFELKDAGKIKYDLTSTFQTLIGFVNNDGAQKDPQGRPPFVLKTEKVGGVDLQVASLNRPLRRTGDCRKLHSQPGDCGFLFGFELEFRACEDFGQRTSGWKDRGNFRWKIFF